jgi:hypothetical protein
MTKILVFPQAVKPFDANWRKGSGAAPLTTQDLFFGDAISIPTAPANPK